MSILTLHLGNETYVLYCRISHLTIGAAFIVVANFVNWLMEVQMMEMATMTLLHLLFLRAVYVIKNVFFLFTLVSILIRNLFLGMNVYFY